MGVSVRSSNLTLPTTRLIHRVKENHPAPAAKQRRATVLRRAARLINRLAEAWFRQTASWWLQARGYTVIYDRHFALDYAPEVVPGGEEPLDRRIHRWLVTMAYPRPSYVIFLDAPGDVLYARKGESTPEELERRRQAFLKQGRRLPGFVRVDATAPLEQVYQQVERAVRQVTSRSAHAFGHGGVVKRPGRIRSGAAGGPA
jgi:thymidylate kinase